MPRAQPSLLPEARSVQDLEQIHNSTSIQPHGLLLLFDPENDRLFYWAGDFNRLLGAEPAVGRQAKELLGAPIHELLGSRVLIEGEEAAYVGSIDPPGRARLSMVMSHTGAFIAVELEPSVDTLTAAAALAQLCDVTKQIEARSTLADACHSAAEQVLAITGFDRVMVCKFLGEAGGVVLAEARAPDVRSILMHRLPVAHLSKRVHDLYRRNRVRIIPDVSYSAAAIEPSPEPTRDFPGAAGVIDLSQCVLRSTSPAHLQQLTKLAIGASMSISLLVDGQFWGVIACNHRRARHVAIEQRLLCRHIGMALSTLITKFDYILKAQRDITSWGALEKALRSIRSSSDPERTLRRSAEQLAQIVDCSGFALFASGKLISSVGRLPDPVSLGKLAMLLEAQLVGHDSFSTDRLGETIAGAPAMADEASGALAVSIEISHPLLALWLRPQQVQEVCWAGNPYAEDAALELFDTPCSGRSTATLQQTASGRSRPWAADEIYIAEQLGKRAEFAMQRHRLKQLNEELGAANATLRSLATTDPLTGLSNRRLFDGRLATEWQRARREDRSIAVVAIDVDNFKRYNDSFGHPAGDECLKQIAAAIAAGHRGVDVAARLGGEEFGVLLTGIAAGEADALAERVRLSVERLGLDHPLNEAGVVTISLGVAVGTPAQWGECSRLISAADWALYEAKASGRNRVHTTVPPALRQ